MAETQQKMSPQEEIQKLEQQLEQKKRELTQSGATMPEEKEMFRKVVKEHIESLRPLLPQTPHDAQLPPLPVPARLPQDDKAKIKQQEADEANVRVLVEKALTGTIEDAVKEAQKISPYMLDELHDHLIDDAYDKLVVLRKIKKL